MNTITDRPLQIGVFASADDSLPDKEGNEDLAFRLGEAVAKSGNILVYGPEKDCDSLSARAARGAYESGGTTVGVTYDTGFDLYGDQNQFTSVLIPCGGARGGIREGLLGTVIDGAITMGGGSGTLNEMTVAYQLPTKPIVVMEGTGGWSDRLAGKYLDDRGSKYPDRYPCLPTDCPEDAVEILEKLLKYGEITEIQWRFAKIINPKTNNE